ncbi:MAG: hypothetical protein IJ638_00920, partial [Alphaproteobacteria bacterium]|nr:hypothetical protein [Alphaproteobacteria bacterium]
VSTSQGTFEATAFAKEKLKWTEVKDNSCKLYISQNTSTNYGYMGSTSINTGIDLNSSGITCTCKDGSASESFSNINNNIGLEKCGRTKDIK